MRRTPATAFRTTPTVAAGALLLAALAPQAAAQVERNLPTGPSTVDTAYFAGLTWRNIGPNRGGRSIAAAGTVARPLEYYFGATGGGLWKTTDGGTTWVPVTDGQIGSASVGSLGICEANPDVVYIGTGETQFRGNIQPGDGLYKSTDAGKTWRHIGLRSSRNFSRVRVHPTDCNTVYAGAFGEYGVPNADRGVYKSTDGGQTWTKVLYRDDRSGAVDISLHPTNPNIVYAALWEAWRKPWGMSSGGPGSGLYRSTDGGATWTEITRNAGLPRGMIGKIGVSVSPVDPNRVYAIIEADSGGVFRSDDGGNTWTRTNDNRNLRQRAFYYTRIVADPQIKDRVYVLNVNFHRSDDGGNTFETEIEVPHGDNHDLWIAANDNKRMIQANDGGANVSVNAGDTWTEQDYPTAQMYRVSLSGHQPYWACGGQQDNSTACVPSKGWEHLSPAADPGDHLIAPGGCESGYVANDPKNTNIFYAGCYGGQLDRFDFSTGQTRAINVWPDNPMGYSAADIKERVQWTFPILFDPQDPNVLYSTSQHVWRSTTEGHSWERISPDLTRHDPATLGPSGGPITRDQTGVETYATVFALAPSRLERDVIWAGSDDGLVHITRDNGQNWQNVTPAGMPEFVKITTIDDSPHRPGTAYLTGHRFLLGDYQPYIYRTEDYGRTWAKITTGIPDDEPARSIREDLARPGLLYLGTDRGVWVSFNNGANWQRLQRNLPTVQVSDVAVSDHDVVIATHGRSFWVLDKIDMLRQMTPEVANRRVHLFAPAPTIRGVDRGVAIDYYLRAPAREVTVEILDPRGNLVRSFTGTPADTARTGRGGGRFGPQQGKPTVKAGLNRFTWDTRYPGFSDFPGMIMWAARNVGPMAVPGRYTVRLTADGQTQTQPFEIRIDPRIQGVTAADLQRRFDFAMQIRDKAAQANDAVLLIRGIEQQIDSLQARTNDPEVQAASQRLEQRMDAVEERIYQVRNRSGQDPLNYPIMLNNKIAALMGVVESAEAPPTEQSFAVFADLSQQLDQQLAALNQVLDQDLAQFNQLLQSKRLPQITRTPLKVDPNASAREEEDAVEGARW